jgi:transcriptional regulator with XRE-family HTH domain
MGKVPHSFGARVRQLMTSSGLDQNKLAAKTGIERSTLNRVLNGKRTLRFEDLLGLARALRVSPGELVLDSPRPRRVTTAIERAMRLSQQLLQAESARDDATARAEFLTAELARPTDTKTSEEPSTVDELARELRRARAAEAQLRRTNARLEKQLATEQAARSASQAFVDLVIAMYTLG